MHGRICAVISLVGAISFVNLDKGQMADVEDGAFVGRNTFFVNFPPSVLC